MCKAGSIIHYTLYILRYSLFPPLSYLATIYPPNGVRHAHEVIYENSKIKIYGYLWLIDGLL